MDSKLTEAEAQDNVVDHGEHTDGTAIPAAMYRTFEKQPFNLGLTGMYGCTSVLLVSTRGVWWSHFWELPSFTSVDSLFDSPIEFPNNWDIPDFRGRDERGTPITFRDDVLDTLRGVGRSKEFKIVGIAKLLHETEIFGPGSSPQMAIITPSDLVGGFSLTPTFQLRYPKHVAAIRNEINLNFPRQTRLHARQFCYGRLLSA